MFSKNLNATLEKVEQMWIEFQQKEYVCSKELKVFLDTQRIYLPSITEGHKFRVIRTDTEDYVTYDIALLSNHGIVYWDIPTSILDTCPQVSHHKPQIGDKFIKENKEYTIIDIDDYDGVVYARESKNQDSTVSRFDPYELDGVLWVG